MEPTTVEHKEWLKKKLKQYGIDESYLLGLAIVVERTVYSEQRRINRSVKAKRPYYMVRDKDGNPTRAWLYLAELALFCKHREYKPAEYVKTLCSMPRIRKRLFYGKKVPINFFSSSTRTGAGELRKLEHHFIKKQQYASAYSR